MTEAEPEQVAGDPEAVKEISSFYQSWIGKRNAVDAVRYTSERLYQRLDAPSEAGKAMHPAERIRKELEMPLARIPDGPNLSDMMSGTQSVNELVRPVEHKNSRALPSWRCQTRWPTASLQETVSSGTDAAFRTT
jgi:hypothetical protein